ncbi:hypothetical protein N7499_004811 [Penicillium canescens]|uniref:uncharacterized protein n=1 Tax=Penicillium canescens TaxID=5083 RepID=UPI0026DF63A3|nr:uncharacterized protein N7446_004685 [Penicillium canescens]KAJ6039996.1 hypothetical protein N7444_008901 [Penicillium canescens]KAJ6067648.1 hypothetical protein N7446_004685 [Penicillium canescens]KAJ6085182.1 hypothetical protein N7499_004811 [Penicillium canescens]
MTLSISIDPDPHGSDHSLSDEDSSGVHVSVPSEGSHDFQDYDEWAHLPYPHELKPSDSASRPRTSRSRPLHGSHSASGRRPTSRRMIPERDSFASRGRRQRSPDSPDSVESDEFPPHFERPPPDRRAWPPTAPPPPGYAHSQSSGPSYNAYPPVPGHQPPYAHPNAQITSDLMRIGHPNQATQPPYGAPSPYGYNPQFQPPTALLCIISSRINPNNGICLASHLSREMICTIRRRICHTPWRPMAPPTLMGHLLSPRMS